LEIENILAALVQKATNESCDWRFEFTHDLEESPVLLATFLPLEMSFDIYDDGVFMGEFELPSPSSDIIAVHIIDAMMQQVQKMGDKRMKRAEKILKAANVVPIKPDKPN